MQMQNNLNADNGVAFSPDVYVSYKHQHQAYFADAIIWLKKKAAKTCEHIPVLVAIKWIKSMKDMEK